MGPDHRLALLRRDPRGDLREHQPWRVRHNVRATCWELHPITALEVLDAPPPSAHELHPALLAQLQKAQVKTLARSASLRAEIAKRHDALLKKYGEDEVREEEERAQAPPKPEEIRKAKSLRK